MRSKNRCDTFLNPENRIEMTLKYSNKLELAANFTCYPFATNTHKSCFARHKPVRPRNLVYSHLILEQLELREWTQQDFAEITGFTQTRISELLHDNTTLGFDTASILGKVFETSTD